MNKKKFVAFIFTIILLLVSNTPAYADIAPPKSPPGSGISPSQETKVQMVAENVLMVVKKTSSGVYIIEVTADFAMKNLGDTDEQMQVRFPLENVSGLGDGRGEHPEVRNFKAKVNGVQTNTKISEESYLANYIPINWAVFNANFPAGQNVLVQVRYVSDVQDDLSPNIEYILGTGAGWFDSIGNATITLRFPYAVSTANILSFGQSEMLPENVVTIGKEIRWHWKDYEPDPEEIVSVSVVNPAEWQQILDLESQIGANPADINTAINLSQTYQWVGSEKHGFMISPKIADLAEVAIEQALPLSPMDIRLHTQLAEVYFWRLNYGSPNSPDDPSIKKLQSELTTIFELDPTSERASEIQSVLQNSLAKFITPTPTITISPTDVVVTEIVTITADESHPSLISTPTPLPEPIARNNNLGWNVLWGTVLFLIGGILGATFRKQKHK